jgi:predicted transcriptional regulator
MALGDLEREVMTQLWDAREPLTVRRSPEILWTTRSAEGKPSGQPPRFIRWP